MIVNLARRAHDHNWELDPITRSLLDTDFYKLLMLQFIWKHYPTTRATFTLMNRSHDVPLGDIVDVRELREQLESTRKRRRRISDLKPERSGVEEPAVIPRNKYKVPASMSVSAFFKIDLNVRL